MDEPKFNFCELVVLWCFGAFVWFGVPLTGLFAIIGTPEPVKAGMIAGAGCFSLFAASEWWEERRQRNSQSANPS